MNDPLFLDTSGWFAAVSPRESRHAEALAAYDAALVENTLLVTTNLIVTEMHALTVRALGPAAGVLFLDSLRSDLRFDLVWADSDLTAAAVDHWLRPFRDHPFSLCDAVSFELMRRRHVKRALALDRHFRTAGFETL